jgi:serine/threonine protein kinase
MFANMQRKGYLHRDIKPDNILLVTVNSKKVEYRMADFGFALKVNRYTSRNVAGTMEYASPKLAAKFKDKRVTVPGHTIKDDVFSFGKTMTEMMTLEIGLLWNQKIKEECLYRYGKDFGVLIDLMMAENESKRADFLLVEEYLSSIGVIGASRMGSMDSSLENKCKSSSVKSFGSTPTINLKHFNLNVGGARNKMPPDSRTKRKRTTESIETTIETKTDNIKTEETIQ